LVEGVVGRGGGKRGVFIKGGEENKRVEVRERKGGGEGWIEEVVVEN
jgi:hypothetical protein